MVSVPWKFANVHFKVLVQNEGKKKWTVIKYPQHCFAAFRNCIQKQPFQFNTQNNTEHGFSLSIFEQNKNVNLSLAEHGKCCNQPWWVTTVLMTWIRRSVLNQNASPQVSSESECQPTPKFLTNGFWKHWVEGTHTNKFERWPFFFLFLFTSPEQFYMW